MQFFHLNFQRLAIMNWKREIQECAPNLYSCLYYGSQNERQIQQEILTNEFRKSGKIPDIILTTYSTATKNKIDKAFLKRFKFAYIILDEAHHIKNADALRSKNLQKIEADQRLLLTGSPLQVQIFVSVITTFVCLLLLLLLSIYIANSQSNAFSIVTIISYYYYWLILMIFNYCCHRNSTLSTNSFSLSPLLFIIYYYYFIIIIGIVAIIGRNSILDNQLIEPIFIINGVITVVLFSVAIIDLKWF